MKKNTLNAMGWLIFCLFVMYNFAIYTMCKDKRTIANQKNVIASKDSTIIELKARLSDDSTHVILIDSLYRRVVVDNIGYREIYAREHPHKHLHY